MENRAAEVDLALATDGRGGAICEYAMANSAGGWLATRLGQGWLGCVGAGCGGFVRIIALPSL